MEHCDITSSQFDSCIELLEKIVKRKTHVRMRTRSRRGTAHDVAAQPQGLPAEASCACQLLNERKSRMNTGDFTIHKIAVPEHRLVHASSTPHEAGRSVVVAVQKNFAGF
jgi:hypothetical protein